MTKSEPDDKCVPVYLSLAFADEGQATVRLVRLYALLALGAEFAAGVAVQALGVRLFGAFQRRSRTRFLCLAVGLAAIGRRHLAGGGHLLVTRCGRLCACCADQHQGGKSSCRKAGNESGHGDTSSFGD